MSCSHSLLESLHNILQQGGILLESVDDQTYSLKVVVAYSASIGGHYRHCLDHFQTLLGAMDQSELDYDQRKRDPRLETDRLFALATTKSYQQEVQGLTEGQIQRPVRVHCQVGDESDAAAWVPSTFGRELVYCVSHAVHHYALIGVMCGLQGIRLPDGFGVASSTIKHQQSRASLQKLAA